MGAGGAQGVDEGARLPMMVTRLPMMVTAPGRSNCLMRARVVVLRRTTRVPIRRATTPMGPLIRKMKCQLAAVVMKPPTGTPTATPRLPTAPHSARPFLRCSPA